MGNLTISSAELIVLTQINLLTNAHIYRLNILSIAKHSFSIMAVEPLLALIFRDIYLNFIFCRRGFSLSNSIYIS
jgi:hypothetical protein